MPELPEVHTTVKGINKTARGSVIHAVWSDYFSNHYRNKKEIKNPLYFKAFSKVVTGAKIIGVRRRGKNILIDLSNGSVILVHMKMTGHFLYGAYKKTLVGKNKEVWEAVEEGPLKDSFNRFVHLVFSLSDGKHLVLSDMRKFARISIFPKKEEPEQKEINGLGPEPLEKEFTYKKFKKILSEKKGPIKKVLLDQTVIAGIGNIYSDEILWASGIHPLQEIRFLGNTQMKKVFSSLKTILRKGIDFRGDSTSDYRDINGMRGAFQGAHMAYRKTGQVCKKKKCGGKIVRILVSGRSAHFCPVHQKAIE
ncbi:MAG: DNA-formamidopyrimidine glycosylase [Patescibacteria group bacterium]|nr:DNA-formamidopyrimidine glycosylase [bacterium]MDZ4240983.1 DNA-formamidopyrimidine glycosylase [Patescibacteria group bacterium]